MPRAGLNRDAVVRLGLEVVDEQGFEHLTLAAVAARAGVAVPSLYKHVGGLGDLRRAVAVVSVDGLAESLRAAVDGTPEGTDDPVVRLAHGLRDHARRWPGRYAATQVAPHPTDPADEPLRQAASAVVEVVASALARTLPGDEPLEGPDLIHTVRAVRAAVHGFVDLELGGGFGLPESLDESFRRLVLALVAGLAARGARD